MMVIVGIIYQAPSGQATRSNIASVSQRAAYGSSAPFYGMLSQRSDRGAEAERRHRGNAAWPKRCKQAQRERKRRGDL